MPNAGTTAKRASKKKAAKPTPSLDELKDLAVTKTALHVRSSNTRKAYEGYFTRAQAFLASFFTEEAEAEVKWKGGSRKGISGDGEGEIEGETLRDDEEFRDAFTGVPTKSTPQAITMFLAYKCFEENSGRSTAEGIHAAFIAKYDSMDGDTYRGKWHFESSRGGWFGNPARSAVVEDIMKSIKHKDGAAGGEHHHSAAMSKQCMDKLYEWSIRACPFEKVDAVPEDLATRNLITAHLRFRAFASTGWTVWSRNAETIQLQYKHLRFNCGNRRGGSPGDPPFFTLSLELRKNWQKNLDRKDGDLRGHRYNIYPQPDTPSVDLYKHMLDWLDIYEMFLGRPLQPDDYIFPSLHVNGVIQSHRNITSDLAQKMITEMATAAGLTDAEHFTTHCFRRGGAQYRFMFAPIGQRWTLARIRWWGGWADGEHRDTLIKYLLDELHTYEQDHADALCPIPRDAQHSHAGEAVLTQPMCRDEARRMLDMHTVETIKAIQETTIGVLTTVASNPAQWLRIDHNSISISHPTNQFPQPALVSWGILPSASSMGLVPDRRGSLHNPIPNPHSASPPSFPTLPTSILDANRPAPAAARIIPNVPKGELGWRQVVKDWEEADPRRGLHVPLRDWPPEWYSRSERGTAASATVGTLRNHRKIIALEFIETYNRHEENFKAAYPSYVNGVTSLLHAIRAVHQANGKIQKRKRRTHA
ncbi:hypothetical protein HWV62_39826 [Athelia sp. TMB]|nr:hypothetical protein HWV62_39826 [Athelia sp. TMB]